MSTVEPDRPLRANRNFARYWTADISSTLGSQLSVIAFPLLVLSLGGSAGQAGLLASCSMLSRLVFRLPGGHASDQWDRRWLMLSADLIRLLALGSIPLLAGLGGLRFEVLLVVAVIEGIATAFFGPAAAIAVRDVVPRADLTRALSRIQSSASTAMLVGPILGGLLFGIDRILPFTVDAASYLLSALLLLRLTVRPPEREQAGHRDNSLIAGVRWLAGRRTLLLVVLYGSVLNLTATCAQLGVVLVLRRQGESGGQIGLVMAGAGVGAVAGSLIAPRLIALLRPGVLFVLIGVVWASGLLVMAARPPGVVVAVALIVMMIWTPAAGVLLGEAVLANTPRPLLGRVNTAVGTFTSGLASIGPLLIGALIGSVGVAGAWSLLAGLALAVALGTSLPLLRLRTLVEPADQVQLAAA